MELPLSSVTTGTYSPSTSLERLGLSSLPLQAAAIGVELGVEGLDTPPEGEGECHLPRRAAPDRLEVRQHLRGSALADQPVDGERHDPPRVRLGLELPARSARRCSVTADDFVRSAQSALTAATLARRPSAIARDPTRSAEPSATP